MGNSHLQMKGLENLLCPYMMRRVLKLTRFSKLKYLDSQKVRIIQEHLLYLIKSMRLTNKKSLEKLRRKNKGNTKLIKALNKLVDDIEFNKWKTPNKLYIDRTDADCVHNDGFYFFNINAHRTLFLIVFEEEEEATVVWVGSHQDYETIFKNNRNTIKKWLSDNDWI